MTEVHLAWVTEYGYPAIFALLMLGIVGVPVPDEALLVLLLLLAAFGRWRKRVGAL